MRLGLSRVLSLQMDHWVQEETERSKTCWENCAQLQSRRRGEDLTVDESEEDRKSDTVRDKHKTEICLVVNEIREMEWGKWKERVGERRDKILARMIIFPYQSLPRRSQMWLWNRWLGQPTKRKADKNRAHKHTHANRLAQSPWLAHTKQMHAHTHTKVYYVFPCFSPSP